MLGGSACWSLAFRRQASPGSAAVVRAWLRDDATLEAMVSRMWRISAQDNSLEVLPPSSNRSSPACGTACCGQFASPHLRNTPHGVTRWACVLGGRQTALKGASAATQGRGELTVVQSSERLLLFYLPKLQMPLPSDPAIPPGGIYPADKPADRLLRPVQINVVGAVPCRGARGSSVLFARGCFV